MRTPDLEFKGQVHTQDINPMKYMLTEPYGDQGYLSPSGATPHVPVQRVSVSWGCIQNGKREGPEGPICAPHPHLLSPLRNKPMTWCPR